MNQACAACEGYLKYIWKFYFQYYTGKVGDYMNTTKTTFYFKFDFNQAIKSMDSNK